MTTTTVIRITNMMMIMDYDVNEDGVGNECDNYRKY